MTKLRNLFEKIDFECKGYWENSLSSTWENKWGWSFNVILHREWALDKKPFADVQNRTAEHPYCKNFLPRWFRPYVEPLTEFIHLVFHHLYDFMHWTRGRSTRHHLWQKERETFPLLSTPAKQKAPVDWCCHNPLLFEAKYYIAISPLFLFF